VVGEEFPDEGEEDDERHAFRRLFIVRKTNGRSSIEELPFPEVIRVFAGSFSLDTIPESSSSSSEILATEAEAPIPAFASHSSLSNGITRTDFSISDNSNSCWSSMSKIEL
jgi:hypothetical protein